MGHVIVKNLDWVEYKIYIRYERNLEERFFWREKEEILLLFIIIIYSYCIELKAMAMGVF
jgi:hypothetical protein